MTAAPSLAFNVSEPRVGDLVAGKYRLIRSLGEGGMGTVWLARHTELDSNVAIKLLRSTLQTPDLEARFEREAKAAAVVVHPAIVRVLDFGRRQDGLPFIVMEPLEGETLAARLERGPLPPEDAVRLLLPIADALSHAHEKGLVHRDLKPDNVFLAREGDKIAPKLLDFGVAKLPREESGANLTRRGMVLGTVSYMAPEQARGLLDVDYRTDIWALSIVLYEAISGTVPFKGDSFHGILRSIIEDEVPPLNRAPSDHQLWAILSRGLAKDRRDRCPSMREFGEGLAAWSRERGVRDENVSAAEWNGKDGAFANGRMARMAAPAWSKTAPAVPLVAPKKARGTAVISPTEIRQLRTTRIPAFAWVAVALAGLTGAAWSTLGDPVESGHRVVANATQTFTAMMKPQPTQTAAPEAPATTDLVAPATPTAITDLPPAPPTAAAPVAPRPRAPSKAQPVKKQVAPEKVVLEEEPAPSPAASGLMQPYADDAGGRGGWIRKALVPSGGVSKARAHR